MGTLSRFRVVGSEIMGNPGFLDGWDNLDIITCRGGGHDHWGGGWYWDWVDDYQGSSDLRPYLHPTYDHLRRDSIRRL